MSWMVAGAMAALGAAQADQQQRQARATNKANMLAAAAQTANSPWTKMGVGQPGAPMGEGSGALLGAAQGGLSGYMMAKANPDMFGSKGEQKTSDYSQLDELQLEEELQKAGVRKPPTTGIDRSTVG